MQEIYNLLRRAYASSLAGGCRPEPEDAISAFESKHQIQIPNPYRWLLREFGACNFSTEPYLYSLEDLDWAWPGFVAAYREYREGYDMPETLDLFPVGGFGDGSTAVLDRNTGKVFILIHDCYEDPPLEEIAADLAALMQSLAGFVIELEEEHGL